MSDRESKKERLRRKSKESREIADELLDNEIETLQNATNTDLEKLRPKINDQELYNKLVAEVEESTRRNESLAELKNRLEKLGTNAKHLAKETMRLLKEA